MRVAMRNNQAKSAWRRILAGTLFTLLFVAHSTLAPSAPAQPRSTIRPIRNDRFAFWSRPMDQYIGYKFNSGDHGPL